MNSLRYLALAGIFITSINTHCMHRSDLSLHSSSFLDSLQPNNENTDGSQKAISQEIMQQTYVLFKNDMENLQECLLHADNIIRMDLQKALLSNASTDTAAILQRLQKNYPRIDIAPQCTVENLISCLKTNPLSPLLSPQDAQEYIKKATQTWLQEQTQKDRDRVQGFMLRTPPSHKRSLNLNQ